MAELGSYPVIPGSPNPTDLIPLTQGGVVKNTLANNLSGKRTSRFIIAPYGDTRPADYTCSGPNDNEVEINAAIIAANALPNGARIDLLDGSFTISASIMRLPNVHVYGQGMGNTTIHIVANGNFNMIDMNKTIYNSSNPLVNSIVADMELDASAMDPTAERKCINGGNFKYCKIFRVYAHDSTATGIGDDDFYGTTIDQCIVENCGYENKRVISGALWAANVFTFTTATPHGYTAWAAASATLTASGTPADGDTVTIDAVVYTFKTILTGAAFEVTIAGSAASALSNLREAISATGNIGVDYGNGTTRHPTVVVGTLTSSTLVITASNIGVNGNNITISKSSSNLSWSGSTLTGGTTGNKIVITGMLPALYNGLFNITSIVDTTHFTISSATNSAGLNFTINPGAPTQFGSSSDSLIGHNGIGIASGSLTAEACIVTNCICIGNQNNNFLIEADANNSGAEVSYLFSDCISINAGQCGFRNTGSLNAQFNNCFDYGSLVGGQAVAVLSNKTITSASWSSGTVTFVTSSAYLFKTGDKVQISSMVPAAYNGYYTVQGTPNITTFTINLASNPGPAVRMGTTGFTVHPVDGSSFNNAVFSTNTNVGLLLPDDGVIATNPVIKNCLNYGMEISSASNCRIENCRVYNSGRQGIYVVMGGNIYAPTNNTTITGHVYNNGQRVANCDGINIDPSVTSAPIQNLTIDVHAFDNQDAKTQRYGIFLQTGGTLSNIQIKGNLSGNATAPILVQNTGNTIYVSDVIGVNPIGRYDLGSVSGAVSCDSTLGNYFTALLTGSIVVTIPSGLIVGSKISLELTQDASGSRSASWPTNVKLAGGSLTLSSGANAIDIINFAWDGTNWVETGRSLNLS